MSLVSWGSSGQSLECFPTSGFWWKKRSLRIVHLISKGLKQTTNKLLIRSLKDHCHLVIPVTFVCPGETHIHFLIRNLLVHAAALLIQPGLHFQIPIYIMILSNFTLFIQPLKSVMFSSSSHCEYFIHCFKFQCFLKLYQQSGCLLKNSCLEVQLWYICYVKTSLYF